MCAAVVKTESQYDLIRIGICLIENSRPISRMANDVCCLCANGTLDELKWLISQQHAAQLQSWALNVAVSAL